MSSKKSRTLGIRLSESEIARFSAFAAESRIPLAEMFRLLMTEAINCYDENDGWPRDIAVIKKTPSPKASLDHLLEEYNREVAKILGVEMTPSQKDKLKIIPQGLVLKKISEKRKTQPELPLKPGANTATTTDAGASEARSFQPTSAYAATEPPTPRPRSPQRKREVAA